MLSLFMFTQGQCTRRLISSSILREDLALHVMSTVIYLIYFCCILHEYFIQNCHVERYYLKDKVMTCSLAIYLKAYDTFRL